LAKPFTQTELADRISSLPAKAGKKGRLLKLRNKQPNT
jgi:hypothetical protein